MTTDVRVVYLVGTPRSGSTLVTSLLGQQPGWFAAGEIRLLWRELDTRRCGCGQLATDCPVWGEVVRRVADTVGDPHRIDPVMRACLRMADLPRITRARHAGQLTDQQRAHAEVLAATYRAVAEVTGAEVVVDSSKSVAEASLLRFAAGVTPTVVHTVRDPRAVAHSWRRAVDRGAIGTPDLPTWSIALRWVLTNATSELTTRGFPGRSLRIRYEDLVRDPEGRAQDVVGLVPTTGGATLTVGSADHIVAGNSLRKQGDLVVTEDRAWRQDLGSRDRRQVSVLTLPVRRHYGYVGGGAA